MNILAAVFLAVSPVNISAQTAAPDSFVTIAWDHNTEDDLSHYTVYIGESPNTNFTGKTTVPAGTNFKTWRHLNLGKEYFFAVTATDFSGNESSHSDTVYAIPGGTQPESTWLLPVKDFEFSGFNIDYGDTLALSFNQINQLTDSSIVSHDKIEHSLHVYMGNVLIGIYPITDSPFISLQLPTITDQAEFSFIIFGNYNDGTVLIPSKESNVVTITVINGGDGQGEQRSIRNHTYEIIIGIK